MARTKQSNRKEEDNAPKAVFGLMMSNERMQKYLHCSPLELANLKYTVKYYMQQPEFNGEPLLGKVLAHFDPNKVHRRALWARVTRHNDACREMLSGSRFTAADKPKNLSKYLESVKTKIVSIHQSAVSQKRRKGVAATPPPKVKPATKKVSVSGGGEQHQTSEEQHQSVEIEQMDQDQDDEEMLPVKDEQPVNSETRPVATTNVDPETRISDIATPAPIIEPATPATPGPMTPAPAAALPSATPQPPELPAASGQSFNDQMMLMMVQNQQMIMKMMSEIQNLKRGGQ